MIKGNMKKITFIMFSIVLFFISTSIYAKDLNISIEDVKVIEKNSEVTISDINFSNDTLTSNINFSNQNDYVVFEVELKNNSDKKYKALGITDNNTLDNIEITYDFDENVNPNESYKFKVKVLYKEKIVNQDSITLNDLMISLNLMDESGDTSSVVINNPVTGDVILHYLVLLIISITGLYFIKKKIRFKINNKKIKVGTFILLFAVVILPFCVFAVEKYTLNLKIKGITLESEYLDYTVSFNTNGGNSIESRTVTYGQQIGELPTGEKDGYNFNGWKDQNGNTVTNTTKVTKKLQLTADFSLVEYSITYDLNHGKVTPTNANPTKYTIEDEIELVNPTRAGYTFAGWSIGNSEEKYTIVRISHETGEKAYKANWSKNEDTPYTVINKYEKLDGTYEVVEDEQHGLTDTEVTAPFTEKTGFDNPEPQQVTISGEGDSTITYIYKRHEYRLTVNEDVETTFTNPTYPYETEITITAKDKTNYEFEKWSNGETDKTITFSITEDTNIYPIYTTNKYTITFNTNGGTTDTESINVNVGEAIGTLPIPTPPTGKVFDGWYTELTDGVKVTSSYVPNNNITIYARYKNPTYTISFDAGEGSAVNDIEVEQGDSIGTLPTSTRNGYILEGWYEENTYETKITSSTIPTGNVTYYAKWEELKVCADNENITTLSSTTCSNNENITVGDGIVCKRAVKLHEETCSQTDTSAYCSGAGYTTSGSKGTSTITYGSCGTSGTLSSGDAFTCDVNGDGDFDELTERFYYVSDYYDTSAKEFDDSTAVLIYYNNVTSGVLCNKNTFAYDSSKENWHGPRTLVSQLPTTSQWSNVSLKSEKRAILAEDQSTHDSPTTTGGTLPTDFSYEGYAARFLTAKELMAGCNLIEVGRRTTGELDSCNYIMENTKYAKSTIGSTGTWLETPNKVDFYSVWYASSYYISVRSSSTNNANFGGARPAIEVPKSKISY